MKCQRLCYPNNSPAPKLDYFVIQLLYPYLVPYYEDDLHHEYRLQQTQ